MCSLTICSLKSLKERNLEVAFIAENRSFENTKNIESKKNSFEIFKCNLVPLMFVKGRKAIEDGCTLINPISKEAIDSSRADSYVAIIDGQHRYMAAINSNLSEEDIFLYESYCKADTKKMLCEANVDSFPWNGADFIKGATSVKTVNPIAIKAKELSDLDYSLTTISEILCFNSNSLKREHYSKMMTKSDLKIRNIDLERANLFLEAARSKFDDDFLKKHYLIRVVISLSTGYGYKTVFKAIQELSDKQVNSILNAKCHEKENLIKEILEEYLKKN